MHKSYDFFIPYVVKKQLMDWKNGGGGHPQSRWKEKKQSVTGRKYFPGVIFGKSQKKAVNDQDEKKKESNQTLQRL